MQEHGPAPERPTLSASAALPSAGLGERAGASLCRALGRGARAQGAQGVQGAQAPGPEPPRVLGAAFASVRLEQPRPLFPSRV